MVLESLHLLLLLALKMFFYDEAGAAKICQYKFWYSTYVVAFMFMSVDSDRLELCSSRT
jgi:hypothetical protein